MEISSADFVASYPKESACPRGGPPEFAFIGRSNVGKSSLINMLTARKGLAKVSGTPGKTRLLNFFLINKLWHLVDLPGYGYARVSKGDRKGLGSLINGYFARRLELSCAFVLIDSNIPPVKIDIEFINSLGELQVPFVIIFTKADRIGKPKLEENIASFMGKLSENWETLPTYFVSSAERRTGREEILEFIGKAVKLSNSPTSKKN
ncbi:MAG: YihA family ribosome biogenesis GTP-binding protein [Saprospiraceae bacterium]|nr:YihA family ribosome biogenesis GTP-binding protein [Saprospiraceae bacterium]